MVEVEYDEPTNAEKSKKKWKVLFEKDGGEGPMGVLGQILKEKMPGPDKPTAQDAQDMEDRLNRLDDQYEKDQSKARKRAEASGVVYKQVSAAAEIVAPMEVVSPAKQIYPSKSNENDPDELEPDKFSSNTKWSKKRADKEYKAYAATGKHNPVPEKLKCKHGALYYFEGTIDPTVAMKHQFEDGHIWYSDTIGKTNTKELKELKMYVFVGTDPKTNQRIRTLKKTIFTIRSMTNLWFFTQTKRKFLQQLRLK